MKKLSFVKAFLAASALALIVPGCSDFGTDENNVGQTAPSGKVALKVNIGNGYDSLRTALPSAESIALSQYTYSLLAESTEKAYIFGSAESGVAYSTAVSPKAAYIDKGTYNFVLTAFDASGKAILAGALNKEITEENNTLAFKLYAATENSQEGTVAITVNYPTDMGVTVLTAKVYEDAGCSGDGTELAVNGTGENGALEEGKRLVSGEISAGESFVKITLSDGTEELGSVTEAVYAVEGITSSSEVAADVEQYKATVRLQDEEVSEAQSIILKAVVGDTEKNKTFTLSVEEGSSNRIYSGYVPALSYNVYVGNGTVSKAKISNTEEASFYATKEVTSIALAWSEGAESKTRYDGYVTASEILSDLLIIRTYNTGDTDSADDYISASAYTLVSGDTELASDAKLSGTSASVKVKFSDEIVSEAKEFALTAVELDSVAISEASALSSKFTVGEKLDLTGLVLDLTYNCTLADTSVEYSTENADEFAVAYYLDENCETEVADIAIAGAGTYYAKITYGGKSTDKILVTVEMGDTYVLTSDSAEITLYKADFGKIGDTVVETGNAYLVASGNSWSSEKTYGSYKGLFYNLASSRTLTLKVKGVYGFRIGAQNQGRTATVSVGDVQKGTLTNPNYETSYYATSEIFYTGSSDIVTITLSKASNSIYPTNFLLYTEAGIISDIKNEWTTLKESVASISESDYWSGYSEIVAARDVDDTGFENLSDYESAISELKIAISNAVKYVAPEAIKVSYNGAEVSTTDGININISKLSENSIVLTASETPAKATGKPTWEVSGIEGLSGTASDDGLTYTIPASADYTGTLKVTCADSKKTDVKVSFNIVISNESKKLTESSIVSIEKNAESYTAGAALTLTATVKDEDETVSEALTYQWYKGEVEIAGATSATFTIAELAESDSGSYSVKVSSESCATGVTSDACEITVEAAAENPTETIKYIMSKPSTLKSGSAANYAQLGESIFYADRWQYDSSNTATYGTGDSKIEFTDCIRDSNSSTFKVSSKKLQDAIRFETTKSATLTAYISSWSGGEITPILATMNQGTDASYTKVSNATLEIDGDKTKNTVSTVPLSSPIKVVITIPDSGVYYFGSPTGKPAIWSLTVEF